MISFFACVAPKAQFALFGIIPLPAWLFVTGVFLMDGYESLTDSVRNERIHSPYPTDLASFAALKDR